MVLRRRQRSRSVTVPHKPGLILPTEQSPIDHVQPFQIDGAGVRGRLVRLGDSFNKAFAEHAYPRAVQSLLAETVVLTAALASGLKFEGIFTLQCQGDGPLGTLMSDITEKGVYRGFAKFDPDKLDELARDSAPEAPVPLLLGSGHVAFTVDQGPDTDRYQGITALTGSNLADCLHEYFRQSEQIETSVISMRGNGQSGHAVAAALVLQKMPDSEGIVTDLDAFHRVATLAASVKPDELLDTELMPETLLFRLFHEDGVRVFEPRSLTHGCRCSEDRVIQTLRSFPASEIMELADDDGRVSVTCEFCKTVYAFDPETVLEPMTAIGPDTLQ